MHQITEDAFVSETKTEKINDYRWSPKEYTQKLSEYRIALKNGLKERKASKIVGVPRSTVRIWDSPISTSYDEKTTRFLQSEEGYFFLHRILTSSLLTFVSTGHCGIRRFCRWLNDSGLSDFVASSYGIDPSI